VGSQARQWSGGLLWPVAEAYAAQAAGGVRQAVAEVERGACRGRRAVCGGGGGAARAGGGVRRPAAEA